MGLIIVVFEGFVVLVIVIVIAFSFFDFGGS